MLHSMAVVWPKRLKKPPQAGERKLICHAPQFPLVPSPLLEAGFVALRPLEPEDAGVLEAYFNDPSLIRLLGLPTARNRDFIASLIGSAQNDPGAIYMAIVRGERVVGYTYLDSIDWNHGHVIESGVLLGERELWGNRIGRAAFGRLLEHAFDTLGLHRASLALLEENTRALCTYEALGFRREGMRREALHMTEGWEDTVLMGVLSHELNRVAIAEAIERGAALNRPRDE